MKKELINAAQALKLASSWVERNASAEADLKSQSNEILLDLGRGANNVSFSVNNLNHRPCIGLFGASQAGKSYLVSKLAAGDSAKLSTHWDEHAVDFITHVNPSGNNSEATGFATRFTHEKDNSPSGYPIELKLLNEVEIAMILINAFFYDINQTDVSVSSDENFYLNKLKALEPLVDTKARDEFNAYPSALLQEADLTSSNADATSGIDCSKLKIRGLNVGRSVTVNGVTEMNYIQVEQVIDLADYLVSNSNGKLGSFETMPNVWMKLREMLPFMTLDGRIKALSMFWQDLPIFSVTYECLARELLKLKGHNVVYAPMSAFVTQNGATLMQNESGTIMHITKLSTMFTDKVELECALAKPKALYDDIMHITKLSTMFTDKVELECALAKPKALYDDSTNAAATAAAGTAAGATGADGRLEVEENVSINASRLAALSLELCFRLENSGKLDDFDVLDLPGARSRDVILLKDVVSDGASYNQDRKLTEAICMRGSEFFRRGKVSYVFERYARRNEIDQLLFCIGVKPGARSRDVILLKDVVSDGASYNQDRKLTEAICMRGSEFFRRGKVSYVFERYARRNEIDQLLFCIGVNMQQDVTSVLTILSDWIAKNVGDTPKRRASGYNPLTIVLTRYDDVFTRQLSNLEGGRPIDMNQEIS